MSDTVLMSLPEYPLSACIAAEWSSTEARGRMLATVFFMQPLGQLCAYGAGLTTLQAFGDSKIEIDKQWRYVVGIGTLPTLLALGFRIFMPESGRYTYEVLRTTPLQKSEPTGTRHDDSDASTRIQQPETQDEVEDQISWSKMWHFLYVEGHWADLFGTSMCWALLDFAFCEFASVYLPSPIISILRNLCKNYHMFNSFVDGLGFSAPSTLEKLWAYAPITDDATEKSIEVKLRKNMRHGIFTFSIAAIAGSIFVIAIIDWVNRKHMLTFTFSLLTIVLALAAATFDKLFQKGELRIVLIMFWNLISFLFSAGPNTLTFIVSPSLTRVQH